MQTASAEEVLAWALSSFGDQFAIVTSFQDDGMAVVDMAAHLVPSVRLITLDTGRLPAETYQMMEQVREKYRLPIEIVFPDAAEVESMVTSNGPNLFYEGVPQRMLCCQIRKVRPLDRKLSGLKAWAVGLRRSQSDTRANLQKVQEVDGRWKISPVADWTREQLDQYLREHDVPRHPLYGQGYASIGCGPCTRATLAGESERAGRWWWEEEAGKECGIHFTPDGKAQRTVDVLLDEVLTGARRTNA
ncbi:MAG TPA: phosphoadenylyl-sulfate reductase [Bryobacteraceae bacterium]|nr:phosphoadenylyl-sulfate reductase [Bryobacteraceae bacterium]